ncbi:unnamed protein product [Blepharisma stoltei]|uniref:Cyclic nucleotide-binding domain-containing protein n=1 Tax=Blepharisma stoltei TaxID=1481888 RepID=A0AAU9IDS2_9CILI|nr:unnamed protein product [Blepharisma stoltei]
MPFYINKIKIYMSVSYDISRITQILQIPSRLRSQEDIAYLMALTSKVDFFRKITEEQKSSEIHKACCQIMTFEERKIGDTIVNFGDNGFNFYIVLKGSASVNIPTKKEVKINLKGVETDKLKKIVSTLSDEEDDIGEIKFDPKKRKRRAGKIFNAVDLISLSTAMQEKENEESDNQQLNEFCKINDLFKDRLDEEKAIILDFLSKQNPEAKVVKIETEELTKVAIINEGESFGELSLISNKPRAATLIAEEKIILGVISKPNFKKILGKYEIKRLNEKIDFLQALPMFSNWSKTALYKLGLYFSRVLYKKHQFVYKEGDLANTVYFVKSGEFKITKIHSELKGVVDVSSLDTQSSRLTSNGTVLRLEQMRKKGIQKQLQLVIKGKNEMIGMEEAMENFDKRIHSCQCWSDEGELLFISRDNLKVGITYPDTWAQLRDIHNANSTYLNQRVKQLIKIEEAKKSLDLKSWSKLPTTLLKREETEKLKEIFPNIKEKPAKEARYSIPDKDLNHSPRLSPEHKRFRSSPVPNQSPYSEKVKTRESSVFKEDKSKIFYNRRVDTGISNLDSPRSPSCFTTDSKKSTETTPYKNSYHRKGAPPSFFINFKKRASSSNRNGENVAKKIAEKFKDHADKSLKDYSAEIYKRACKSYFL